MNEKMKLPELTLRAVLLGVILSIILAGANAYLGLFAGMTVSASIPAVVVSMGLLRLLRKGNILENNIVQTAASAGESLAAGVIFTMPALLLLDYWESFSFFPVFLIAGFGGLLGVLFTVPLRRAFIVEAKLKFPEGIATAEVLKSGQQGEGLVQIAKAAIAGGLFKIASGGLRLWPGSIEYAWRLKGSIAYFGTNLSPALLSVGYIVGLNIAVLIFIGGLINWLVAIPICASMQDWPIVEGEPVAALKYAGQLWSEKTRYIGVGAMLTGGLWTIFKLRGSLFAGIRAGISAYRKADGEKIIPARTEKDIPVKWILILIAVSIVPLFMIYQYFVKDISVTVPMALVMVVTGFVFSAVAGYMSGLVGSSNNPVSGITIATVLVSALLLVFLMGQENTNGPAAAIIIGSVVCCAAAIAGDNMQDLKAGYIVGATPWKQQLMQIVGAVSAAFVLAPVLILLQKAYGFAGHKSATENALAAPQANLMASVAREIFHGQLPQGFVLLGIVLGIAVIVLDEYLQRRGSVFRTPVLAVAIGIYLPFELEVPIFIGGLIAWLSSRGRQEKSNEGDRRGLLLGCGLITGEALMGILLAVPIVIAGRTDILALFRKPLSPLLGVIMLAVVVTWLWREAVSDRQEK
jgi:putative OPT family oligopeptide transporter